MSAPRVSVLMPARNAGPYIAEAVRSVLAQTFADFELIVVDNGSTDATPDVLASIADPRLRVTVLPEEHSLPAVRNAAVALARGALIAMMDADDISLPKRLARQVALLDREPGVGVCGAWMRTLGATPEYLFRFETGHEAIACEMLFDSHLAHGASMVRAVLLRALDPPYPEEIRIAEDYALWTTLLPRTRFAAVPEVLYRYRAHATQVSATQTAEQAAMTRSIHARMLDALGLPTDAAALDLHTAISRWAMPRDIAVLDAVHRWFESICAANDRARVHDPRVLRAQLAKRFFFLCNLYADGGPSALARFRAFALHREAKVSASQRMRQAWKAALRIDVRGRREAESG
jgi:glycosyltransferase involved in cell wall biosynthesis